MSTGNGHFNLLARVLHWSMALMIIAMLFIGVTMVASLHLRPMLIDLHRPLGIALGVLVLLRLYNRLRHRPPADLPVWQVMAARASHWMLYALMLAMPLIGWAMLSAGGYPVHLPPIVPHTPALYAALRNAHSLLAYVLFATVLMHVGAALFHLWVRRDGCSRRWRAARIERVRRVFPADRFRDRGGCHFLCLCTTLQEQRGTA